MSSNGVAPPFDVARSAVAAAAAGVQSNLLLVSSFTSSHRRVSLRDWRCVPRQWCSRCIKAKKKMHSVLWFYLCGEGREGAGGMGMGITGESLLLLGYAKGIHAWLLMAWIASQYCYTPRLMLLQSPKCFSSSTFGSSSDGRRLCAALCATSGLSQGEEEEEQICELHNGNRRYDTIEVGSGWLARLECCTSQLISANTQFQVAVVAVLNIFFFFFFFFFFSKKRKKGIEIVQGGNNTLQAVPVFYYASKIVVFFVFYFLEPFPSEDDEAERISFFFLLWILERLVVAIRSNERRRRRSI